MKASIHVELLKQAKKAIDELYSDQSVSVAHIKADLKELIEDIEIKLDVLGDVE